MKKKLLLTVMLLVFCTVTTYATDFRIFEVRNKLFQESKDMKELLPITKDQFAVLMLFNTATTVVSQIDAYFAMMGIFNAVRRQDLDKETVGYLLNWVGEMKRANDLNIKTLNEITMAMQKDTRVRLEKVKSLFSTLGGLLDADRVRLKELMRVAKPKKK